MINRKTVRVAQRMADFVLDSTGNTLKDFDRDNLYEDVFEFYLDLCKRYTSDTIDSMLEYSELLTNYHEEN